MLVFLCDFTKVCAKHARSEETLEMKLRLWKLYYMVTNVPLNPNWNNYVELAWNVCQSTKSLADTTSYNQESVESRMNWELNDTSGGVRRSSHEQGPFRELEFYQCVTKCCSPYKQAQNFFLNFVLEPPHQPFIIACFSLSSRQALVILLQNDNLSIRACCIMLIFFSYRLWCSCRQSSSLKKLQNSTGKPTFPPGIVKFCLEAYWAPELCNSASQDSSTKLCNSFQQGCSTRNYAILGNNQLLCLKTM